MARIRRQERIVVAPDLHHGEPCIKGTRVPVAMIVGVGVREQGMSGWKDSELWEAVQREHRFLSNGR